MAEQRELVLASIFAEANDDVYPPRTARCPSVSYPDRERALEIARAQEPDAHKLVAVYTPAGRASDWCVEVWRYGRANVRPVDFANGVLA